MRKPLKELTYDDVVDDGLFLEQSRQIGRYLYTTDDGEEHTIHVHDNTCEIVDPDAAGDDGLDEEEDDDGDL